MSKYSELPKGKIEAVINKLGGIEGVQNFLSGKTVVKPAEPKFPIWKTVTIGKYKSGDEYLASLKERGLMKYFCYEPFCLGTGLILNQNCYGKYDKPILKFSETEKEVKLVKICPEDIGLKWNASFKQITDRAFNFGLRYAPAEVGYALLDQGGVELEEGETIQIAAKLLFYGGHRHSITFFKDSLQEHCEVEITDFVLDVDSHASTNGHPLFKDQKRSLVFSVQ
jgi:hypothetical protein